MTYYWKNIKIFFCTYLLFFVIGCNNESEIKKEYYANGNIKSEVPIINGKENGLKRVYYENGQLKVLMSAEDNLKHGYVYHYYENGNLESIAKYNKGKADGDFFWFNEDGALKYFSKFKNESQSLYMQFDTVGNIYKSHPILTVRNNKDTIKLGETFSAEVNANFYLKDYPCFILAQKNNLERKDTATTLFVKVGPCPCATYTETPTSTGRHIYKLELMQPKFHPTVKDSVVGSYEKDFTGEYWVIE